jgi:hypothetical protein
MEVSLLELIGVEKRGPESHGQVALGRFKYSDSSRAPYNFPLLSDVSCPLTCPIAMYHSCDARLPSTIWLPSSMIAE